MVKNIDDLIKIKEKVRPIIEIRSPHKKKYRRQT